MLVTNSLSLLHSSHSILILQVPTTGPTSQPTPETEVNAESISSPTPKCEESQGTTQKPTRKMYSSTVRERPTRQPVCTSMMESYSTSADTEATKPVRNEYPSRYGNNLFLDGESSQSRPSSSPTSAPTPSTRVRPLRWPNMFDAVSTDKTTDTTHRRPRGESTNLRVRGNNIFKDEPG